MGWMRAILLGDIGNRLDIADTEKEISNLRRNNREKADVLNNHAQVIHELREALGQQTLVIQALTRFLIQKGLVVEAELSAFIDELDAEDGSRDGRMTRASGNGGSKPHPPLVSIPTGTYRKPGAPPKA